jgi:hypothetical protein
MGPIRGCVYLASFLKRQTNAKQGAFANLAFDGNGTAMGGHNLLGNKQPQAQPRDCVFGRDAFELLENTHLVLFVDADP